MRLARGYVIPGLPRNPWDRQCHSWLAQESRGMQAGIWLPAPRFRGDKFREEDLYPRILLLLKIYTEFRLVTLR